MAEELVHLVRNMSQEDGQSDSRRVYEGFLKYSDPMAWGRVIRMLKCNTVYLARY